MYLLFSPPSILFLTVFLPFFFFIINFQKSFTNILQQFHIDTVNGIPSNNIPLFFYIYLICCKKKKPTLWFFLSFFADGGGRKKREAVERNTSKFSLEFCSLFFFFFFFLLNTSTEIHLNSCRIPLSEIQEEKNRVKLH